MITDSTTLVFVSRCTERYLGEAELVFEFTRHPRVLDSNCEKDQNIEQTVTFNAKPKKVFKTLLNSAKHSAFTGESARIERKPGGAFACYGEYITGITLELEPNKRIVQAWRSQIGPRGHIPS